METKKLGSSDLHITRLGFGAWAIGGSGWSYAWGAQDDGASIEAINRALDLGVNWIDTAAIYGLGHSEEVVARALAGRRERPLVFTKCGLVADEQGEPQRVLAPASIRREVEASLRRLRTAVIDLYQIHWPAEGIEDAWGRSRGIGVTNRSISPRSPSPTSHQGLRPGLPQFRQFSERGDQRTGQGRP